MAKLGFWTSSQFLDLETKIKEKENKREVIAPRIHASAQQ
jgi:hypothetical protein